MTAIPETAIGAAWEVLHGLPGWPPYFARARDYVHPGSIGEERERQVEFLAAADREADAKNRAAVKRVLQAATPHIVAAVYRDVLRLMAEYEEFGRGVITEMPFAASLDQIMAERYGLTDAHLGAQREGTVS
jgi:hypothetical protein